MIRSALLAHSWGWDEALYFAIPVALAVLWVRRIEKRPGTPDDTGATDREGDEADG